MITFSPELKNVLEMASQLAVRTGGIIYTEHLMYGLVAVDTSISSSMSFYGVNEDALLQKFTRQPTCSNVVLSQRAVCAIDSAKYIATFFGSQFVMPDHLFYAILDDNTSVAVEYLMGFGVDIPFTKHKLYEKMKGTHTAMDNGVKTMTNSPETLMFDDILKDMRKFADSSQDNENTKRKTSILREDLPNCACSGLDGYGTNLNEKAINKKLDPVIGRGKEIERIIQILCRRTKNNPILIGEPGVGKSAIIDGLAQAIVDGNVPDMLRDKIVFSLDIASMVAGTRYRGDFEERIKNAFSVVQKQGNIILFIDEIHTILKAGSTEGGLDVANIMKPMLARGELQTIGATTLDEYSRYFENDAALERRFQPIVVEQPTVSDTIEILQGLKDKYQNHHQVAITDEAISAAAILSDRYITDRFLPDKAIDLIDEASSRKKIFSFTVPSEIRELEEKIKQIELDKNEASKYEQYQKAEKLKAERDALIAQKEVAETNWRQKCGAINLSIGEEEIAEIVSNWTGVPVTKITEGESEKLASLESALAGRVIGQSEAVSAVARAIKRARAGLKDPKRPIGSFIFLGPTGVGKTELCKALAESLFGDENLLIRVDMSEYMAKENVSKLIGSAPGYVGYEEGGQLTEKVRRKPYSVVLFDEIEKAHSEVFNILLQILEDGRLTDSRGRVVNFKNTVIIMTSNIGASEISQMKTSLGFNSSSIDTDYESMKEKQMKALKDEMKPELINRIDEIIIFRRLTKDNIDSIANIMFKSLSKRLDCKNVSLHITDEAKNYIVSKGYNEEYGARPLRRAIQRLVEDKLSEMVLDGSIVDGDNVYIAFDGFDLTYKTSRN